MKKLITIILSVILCISISVPVFAYDLINGGLADIYEKAAQAWQERYPEIPLDEIRNILVSDEGLDTEKIKEALDALIEKYKPTTEPTTKPTTVTPKPKPTEPTTQKPKPTNPPQTTPTLPFTYTNPAPTTNPPINIVLPNQGITPGTVTEPQSTQAVGIYQVQTTGIAPGINNNTTQPNQPSNNPSKGISSKTIMAIVIIAVGGLLLLVSIVVLASTSNNSTRRRRRPIHAPKEAVKDYVPIADKVDMPVVKVNTAADLASKKKGLQEEDAQIPVKYNLSAFNIPIDTFSQGESIDKETSDAIDAAIAYMAEEATEKNRNLAKEQILDSEFETIADELKAEQILSRSINSNRVCEECGTFVSDELMFCPQCGSFMGIKEEASVISYTVDESSIQASDDTSDEDIQPIVNETAQSDKFSDSAVTTVAKVKICPQCSAEFEEDLMFCPECGSFAEE